MKKVCIVGAGYVGLAIATMLSKKNRVVIVEIDQHKIDLINKRKSPIKDLLIEEYFAYENLNLYATSESLNEYEKADIIIIALPTNYNDTIGKFDTSSIDKIISDIISVNEKAIVVVRSTIPIGYMNSLKSVNMDNHILYCPEFLREASALKDNLNPNRLIIGIDKERIDSKKAVHIFTELMKESIEKKAVEIMVVGYFEAESIKLFSNAYLAMRVAFFNELDNFSIINKANTEEIIRGVCLDSRIGMYYNNPSFGFGGYCLPKDIKQLKACYGDDSECLISAIIDSNKMRKKYIVKDIINKTKDSDYIGIYRLAMKMNSDNSRNSAIISIIQELVNIRGKEKIIIYEPTALQVDYDFNIVSDLKKFKNMSNIIIANRFDSELEDVLYKVYTRDVFARD